MKHSFNIGDRVRQNETGDEGEVITLTTFGEIISFDCGTCEDDEKDDPWYEIKWDHDWFTGDEFEGSLTKI